MTTQDLNNNRLLEPPDYIDGAKVLKWAWSGQEPFGFVGEEEIYGLAICQYEDSASLYRFSCDKSWDTIQDSPHDTVEDAVIHLPDQYKNVEAVWQFK